MKPLLAAAIAALTIAATAGASPLTFTHPIGTYERAVGAALDKHWPNDGTDCKFRSGRTVVYCMTDYRTDDGPIQTTLRRISATRIRVRVTFLGSLHSGIPKLVKAAVQLSTIKGT